MIVNNRSSLAMAGGGYIKKLGYSPVLKIAIPFVANTYPLKGKKYRNRRAVNIKIAQIFNDYIQK